jgi:hypothetical protein
MNNKKDYLKSLSQEDLADMTKGDADMFKQHEIIQAAKRKGMDDRDYVEQKDTNKNTKSPTRPESTNAQSPEPNLSDLHPNKRIL